MLISQTTLMMVTSSGTLVLSDRQTFLPITRAGAYAASPCALFFSKTIWSTVIMAVLNSNFTRFFLLIGLILILTACSNLEIPSIESVGDLQGQLSSAATSAPEIAEPASEESQPVEDSDAESPPPATEIPAPTASNTQEPSPAPENTATPTPESEPAATNPPEPTPLPASIRSETAEMVLVNEGEFEMGALSSQLIEACSGFLDQCDEGWFTPSEPIHEVQVDSFYVDVYEVTNDAYLQFINDVGEIETACDGQLCIGLDDSQIESDGEGLFIVDEAFLNHPVTGVTWYGAVSFCEWRDARLPSEAEWEMAASWDSETGSKYLYPWGNEYDGSAANSCDINCDVPHALSEFDDGSAALAPVGSYENGRSPAGAYDMAGNVWEWIYDWYDAGYYGQSPESNPSGPEEGDAKVVHGGSWFDTGNFAASAVRFPAPPAEFGDTIGFRCAVDALPAEVLAQVPEAETESDEATAEPTVEPTAEPTVEPTTEPTVEPTAEPTVEPTAEPTVEPTAEPTIEPTAEPTIEPTAEPTVEPTAEPTAVAGDGETPPAPISINCNLHPGIDRGSTYVVGACDWLAKIADKLGITYASLIAVNPQITDPNIIHRGQVLNLPARPGIPASDPPPSPQPPVPSGPPAPPGQSLGP
jgi:formylglycine-generating enzyme required for sulfatase activity/LysM repeat protein